MSEDEEKVQKCICGKDGCNLECDPITFSDEEDDGCYEPSCNT